MVGMGATFVVSDVHGHLDDFRAVLARAGLVSEDRWVGDDATLWVLGDLVDRGPNGIGVLRLVRSLVEQDPDHVHMLMGNHEALMLGERLFPDTRFADVWRWNGGQVSDQEALDDDDVAWLRGLPAMGRSGDYLLMHSDTTSYLTWGRSVEEVNATLRSLLGGDDPQAHFDVFAALTSRFDFVGPDGADVARQMLATYGGDVIVHGHSIIGSLVGKASREVREPLWYADGLAIAIDGGRYDGGPLLLVRLGGG
jgi:Calcineurin-like phosphoesterase